MKLFTCSACQGVAFFENSLCTRCGHVLAYLPDRGALSAMAPSLSDPGSEPGGMLYIAVGPANEGARYRLCRNYTTHAVCNWAVHEHDAHEYCPACRMNESTPDLSNPSVIDSWQRMEVAKRRLLYTLLSIGLPVHAKQDQPETGLAFAFKEDGPNGEQVLTGHCDGLVTINMNEADSSSRERTRELLGERYRTLLGHFRHESGHFYWDRLIRDGSHLERFRALFGDERCDYAEAVRHHYATPRLNWTEEFVSAYATMHPWEDWAETWAHYLHMVDTLETAQSYGLVLKPRPVGGAPSEPVRARRVHFDDFQDLIGAWVPLTVALNSLNRSMGLPDVYPFVLGERVIEKLAFVHEVVEQASPSTRAGVAVEVKPSGIGAAPPPRVADAHAAPGSQPSSPA